MEIRFNNCLIKTIKEGILNRYNRNYGELRKLILKEDKIDKIKNYLNYTEKC